MTSRDFVRLTGVFVESGDAFDYLNALLRTIHEAHVTLSTKISGMIRTEPGTNLATNAHNEFRATVSGTSTEIRSSFRTQSVWAGVEDLRRRIEKVRVSDISVELGESVGSQLSLFSDAYEEFVSSYSVEKTFTLVDTGNDLYQSIEALKLTATLATRALESHSQVQEGEAELELILYSNPTATEFTAKLAALVEIYDKICELFAVNAAANPLRISKIESGSWIVKVAGSLPVIGVITRLVEATAQYFYRNFIKEGQISELPRKAEVVERILDLKKNLEEQGLDTSGMKENIEKSSVLLSQKLNVLLGGEPKIVINAIEVNVAGGWLNQQQITGGGKSLLEDIQPDQLPPPSTALNTD